MGSLTVKSGHRISQPTTPPGQKGVPAGGQRRGGTSRRAGVGAKYFNNSSLTGRARRGERRSVPDAVGAAARGDRSAPVLHAEVSENISEHTNNSERNIKREAGKDTGHADHEKAWGKEAVDGSHSRRQHDGGSAENTEVIPFFMNVNMKSRITTGWTSETVGIINGCWAKYSTFFRHIKGLVHNSSRLCHTFKSLHSNHRNQLITRQVLFPSCLNILHS